MQQIMFDKMKINIVIKVGRTDFLTMNLLVYHMVIQNIFV